MRPDTVGFSRRRRPWHILAPLSVLVAVTACAPAGRLATLPAALSPADGAAVLARVETINRELQTFKGIGRLDIETPERHQTARVAWAGGLANQRLRLDLIGAGLPMASMASDGRRIYLRRSADGSVQSRSAADPSLDGLLGLPVTVSDILSALAGRLPDISAPRVDVYPQAAGDGLTLVFQRRFGSSLARARVDPNGDLLYQLAFYRRDGALHYRIDYSDHRRVDGYLLPHCIEIRDSRSALRIRVTRWWTDVTLDAAVFVLTTPAD